MKTLIEYTVIFALGLGEGVILCDWRNVKTQLKTTKVKK